MREFAAMFAELDGTTKTNQKVAVMAGYFRTAPPEDAAWALYLLTGRRPKRVIATPTLAEWARELAGLSPWLFQECYDAVGDLAETITLVIERSAVNLVPNEFGLAWWIEQTLLPLSGLEPEVQREAVLRAWQNLPRTERFLWTKLSTGIFRVGVSQDLVIRALAHVAQLDAATIAHRLMGSWEPTAEFYASLLAPEEAGAELGRPYPFCLAHPLEGDPAAMGNVHDWHAEWKWDGIRAQVIRRRGETFVWSRGEELIGDRFPEVLKMAEGLPDGTVLDGEILAWNGKPMSFSQLQRRIGRKTVGKKLLSEVPVAFVAFDLLELDAQDLRGRPLRDRRAKLELLCAPGLLFSESLRAEEWSDLAVHRRQAREHGVEGLMLKSLECSYGVGRKKGVWWKWKIEPCTMDAVLMYAQRGSGIRASLYTDYTFGVWRDGELVPVAKAYSGLDQTEIRAVDAWIRAHTLEKFGPVRTVSPELVFELAFEGIQPSSRHKSGLAVRFPRIVRWRQDKLAHEADSLDTIRSMLASLSAEEVG